MSSGNSPSASSTALSEATENPLDPQNNILKGSRVVEEYLRMHDRHNRCDPIMVGLLINGRFPSPSAKPTVEFCSFGSKTGLRRPLGLCWRSPCFHTFKSPALDRSAFVAPSLRHLLLLSYNIEIGPASYRSDRQSSFVVNILLFVIRKRFPSPNGRSIGTPACSPALGGLDHGRPYLHITPTPS